VVLVLMDILADGVLTDKSHEPAGRPALLLLEAKPPSISPCPSVALSTRNVTRPYSLLHHFDRNSKEYAEINLERIQHLIDTGRLDASLPITLKSFMDAGINGIKDGVKILGGGHHHFRLPIEIHATRFTNSAIKAIESCGGKALAVYHSESGLRQLKNPDRFWRKDPEAALQPLQAPKRLRERMFYSQTKNRGYQAGEMQAGLTAEFKEKYQMI